MSQDNGRVTEQQRYVLGMASRHQYVTARMFQGTIKPPEWAGTFYRTMTMGSAQAVMRRLSRRGLLDQDERNPAIFRINDAGRAVL